MKDVVSQRKTIRHIIPALGHNWSEEIVKPATCTDEGLKRQTSLRCGESNDTVIPALGGEHEWGEWAVTKPATEKETGQKERACENCGVVETEIIPVMVTSVTVNSGTVSAKTLMAAVAKAGGDAENIKTFVLGNKVKKISKYAFKNYKNAKTLVVKTKKLKKAKVKNSLKGSAVTKVKVKVGSKKINKKYVKKYKKIFTKKNACKKVKVTL